MSEPTPLASEQLGALADPVAAVVEQLIADDVARRLWARDHTLWQPDPTEVADRLGWLDVAAESVGQLDELEAFAAAARADGITHAVVLGMGGSSLFPEVIARTFPSQASGLELRVLDTTDPAAIARVSHECPLAETLFVVSSKSGSTIETRSQLDLFWSEVGDPSRFVVITDAGSELDALGTERGVRAVFRNRPDLGGRYSALSLFGLVPAALAGVDLRALLAGAVEAAAAMGPTIDPRANPGLRLGAILGTAVQEGRDKVTLVIDGEIDTFGLWLEQLLAESTGKRGTGIVPVAGERLGPPEVYGDDRLFVAIGTHHGLDRLAEVGHPVVSVPDDGPASLGAQVLLWEVATAICGVVLGLNPFDQPNVAEAKRATAEALADGLPDIDVTPLATLLEQVRPGDYLAIQAYLDPDDGVVDALEDARTELRDRLRVATTLGLGPRYLHSTGQLHKGGPATGVFVQVVGDDPLDLDVPGRAYSFATLMRAQAAGDLATLHRHGLRAARVSLAELLAVTA